MNGTLNGRGAVKKKITTSKTAALATFQFFPHSSKGRVRLLSGCDNIFIHIFIAGPVNRDLTTRCAMAKGEGGEQYSNASLLNKPGSPDGIKLARKVSEKYIHIFFFPNVLD